jgi:hypothetical protein
VTITSFPKELQSASYSTCFQPVSGNPKELIGRRKWPRLKRITENYNRLAALGVLDVPKVFYFQ